MNTIALCLLFFAGCRSPVPQPGGLSPVARQSFALSDQPGGWVFGPTDRVATGGPWFVDVEPVASALGLPALMVPLLNRTIPVLDGGPLAPTNAAPILLLPGATNIAQQSTALALELASRGSLVVQVDLGFGLQDLDVEVNTTRDGAIQTYEILESQALDAHVAQTHAVMDWVANHDFGDVLDPNRMLLIGHSHGGGVAMQACQQRTDCERMINLDGPVYSQLQSQGLDRPWFHLASRDPQGLSQEDLQRLGWADFYPEVKTLELQGVERAALASPASCGWYLSQSGHLDFTDMPFLIPNYRSDLSPKDAHTRLTAAVLTLASAIPTELCEEWLDVGFTVRWAGSPLPPGSPPQSP